MSKTAISHVPLDGVDSALHRLATDGQAVVVADYLNGDVILAACNVYHLDPKQTQAWLSAHRRDVHGVCAAHNHKEGVTNTSVLHNLQMLRWEIEQGLRDDGRDDWGNLLGHNPVPDNYPEVMGLGD